MKPILKMFDQEPTENNLWERIDGALFWFFVPWILVFIFILAVTISRLGDECVARGDVVDSRPVMCFLKEAIR